MKLVFSVILALVTLPTAMAMTCDGLPTVPVDKEAVLAQNKEHEFRYFVPSKLDPIRGACPGNIEVFARMIPKGAFAGQATRDRAQIKKAPTLFYIFGGPAFSSEWYTLSYNWDYENPQNNEGKTNGIAELNKYFNIVVMDQRGNIGYSNPLDTSDHDKLNIEAIARMFTPTTLAFDQANVIDQYIASGLVDSKNYYVLGKSFGEAVMWNYANLIRMGKVKHRPAGLIGSSGNMPFFNMARQWASVRSPLEAYNWRIEKWSKDKRNGKALPFSKLILNVRAKMQSIGKNPDAAYAAYWPMMDSAHNEKVIYETYEALWADFTDPTKDPNVVFSEFFPKYVDQSFILNHIMCPEGLWSGAHSDDMAALVGNLSRPWMLNQFRVYSLEEEFTLAKLRQIPQDAYITPAPYKMSLSDARAVLRMGVPVALQWGRWDTIVSSSSHNRQMVFAIGNLALLSRVTVTDGTHEDFFVEKNFKKVFKTLGLNL